MQYLCYHWSVLRSKLLLFLLSLNSWLYSFVSCSPQISHRFLSLSRSFKALIIVDDSHWRNVECLTRLLLIGACFSTTGRKASYQAVSAWFGSEKLKTLAKGREAQIPKKGILVKVFKTTILDGCMAFGHIFGLFASPCADDWTVVTDADIRNSYFW